MGKFKDIAPGIAATLIIALIAFLTSSLHASFDILVISMIFGILVSSMLGERALFQPGIEAALKIFLPAGIALYGLQLTVGTDAIRFWPAAVLVFALIFLTTYLVSRAFGLEKDISFLLCSGMSICGASAIVVMSPLIGAKREDTSISLISVLTLGLTGMLLYKFLFHMAGVTPEKSAFLSGMTLPMIGQVKVAASGLGGQASSLAMTLKLIRVSFLLVISCGVLIFLGRRRKKFHVPWFMVLFFLLAVAANVIPGVAAIRKTAEPFGRFFLATALSGIGLSIDIDTVTERGARPLLAVFVAWGIVVSMLYLALNLINV